MNPHLTVMRKMMPYLMIGLFPLFASSSKIERHDLLEQSKYLLSSPGLLSANDELLLVGNCLFAILIIVIFYHHRMRINAQIHHSQEKTIADLLVNTRQQKAQIDELTLSLKAQKHQREQLTSEQFYQTNIWLKIKTMQDLLDSEPEKAHPLTMKERETLKKALEQHYQSLIKELQKDYGFNEENLTFYLLEQVLHLPNKVIAYCFGYTGTQAINQRRMRVKKIVEECDKRMVEGNVS